MKDDYERGLLMLMAVSAALLLIAFRGASSVPISTSPSTSVRLFTVAVALATGVVFGVGPAWMASGADPAEALRGSSRVTRGTSAFSQKALGAAARTVAGAPDVAGLLTRSLSNLETG